jgi:hypothetical protein
MEFNKGFAGWGCTGTNLLSSGRNQIWPEVERTGTDLLSHI